MVSSMMWHNVLITADSILWLSVSMSALYIFFFACAGKMYKPRKLSHKSGRNIRFHVIFPAYREDCVIVDSVSSFLRQDYPSSLYDVTVVSDHMSAETNNALASLPIKLITLCQEKSSKAIALQAAMKQASGEYDYVVILDADNITEQDFLSKLCAECSSGHTAYQCHRCSKNKDNDVSQLDSLSEEINNTIFRKGHNAIGLSSALIGSGMCIGYEWFAKNVVNLNTSGEDRELEAMLINDRNNIIYLDNIPVYDEKVSSAATFQRQRLRWMTAQLQSLIRMLGDLPKALVSLNIDYIDKTIQQALIPRSILLVLSFFLASIHLIFLRGHVTITLLYCILFIMAVSAVLIAIPGRMLSTRHIGRLSATFLCLVMRMIANIIKIDRSSKDFIHTTHGQS